MLSNEKWFGASPSFYNGVATQSLKMDDADDSFLSKTFSSSGNRKTWTFSWWFKRANLVQKNFISVYTGGSDIAYLSINIVSNDKLRVSGWSTEWRTTNQVFRDTTNWYHCLVAFDTTQSTANDRIKIYINGSQVTNFDVINNFGQNEEPVFGANNEHRIGKDFSAGSTRDIDGYLSEVNYVNGLALTPSSFGEFKNGVWIPKQYTGSYGTNGFRLEFKNTSVGSGSSSTIGADTSGNGNHFTSTNVVASDCNMSDSPENNFANFSQLNSNTNSTLSEGGLRALMGGSGNYDQVRSDFGLSSGKWYWEVYVEERGYISSVGVFAGYKGNNANPNHWVTFGYGGWFVTYNSSVAQYQVNQNSSGGTNWSGATLPVNGDIIMIAIDVDNNKIWWGLNGTWYNSSGTANPATGTDARVTLTSDQTWHPMATLGTGGGGYSNAKIRMNFGQDSTFQGGKSAGSNADENGNGLFQYAPPSGYLACCSSNLLDTTLSPNQNEQADDYFNTVLYTANNQTAQSITGVNFRPDWLWFKQRSRADSHALYNTSMGIDISMRITTDSEYDTTASATGVTALGSDGFTLGTDQQAWVNYGSDSMVAWNWKAGGTTPTKTYKVVVVSDSGNKYRFRNSADSATFAQSAVTLDLQEGGTYTFDLSDSTMSGHPLRFSTTSDGTHGGGSEYTTGVTTNGTAGSAGATVTITVASSAPTLYYYCSNHSGMGGQVNTNSTFGQTNFDGSVLSVEQANTTAGFSIVLWQFTTSANNTVGHGLGVAPDMMIIKSRTSTYNWDVYHKDLTDATKRLNLNLTNGEIAGFFVTDPTNTLFTYASNALSNNDNAVAYCFTEVEGYSKFGSYTGNNSTDGTYVHLGFRPSFIMIKATAQTESWGIHDNKRNTFNVVDNNLLANVSNAENAVGTARQQLDFLSNGFKLRNAGDSNSSINNESTNYIYMAFAEQPFKFSNAR